MQRLRRVPSTQFDDRRSCFAHARTESACVLQRHDAQVRPLTRTELCQNFIAVSRVGGLKRSHAQTSAILWPPDAACEGTAHANDPSRVTRSHARPRAIPSRQIGNHADTAQTRSALSRDPQHSAPVARERLFPRNSISTLYCGCRTLDLEWTAHRNQPLGLGGSRQHLDQSPSLSLREHFRADIRSRQTARPKLTDEGPSPFLW